MKNKFILFIILALHTLLATANDGNEISLTKSIDFGLSTTSYPAEALSKSMGTGAVANTLNIDIALSRLRIWGYGHLWYDYKNSAGKSSNGGEVKRIILMADAQITKKISFFLMYDAAVSSLHEYYGQYNFAPWAQLRIGQFKQPFTLESIYSPTFLSTILYDPSVLYLAGIASDPLIGNNVGRDTGIMLTGDFLKNSKGRYLLNYSIGVFNGPGMNQKENNSQKDIIGMLKYMPGKNFLIEGSFLAGTGHALSASPYGNIAQGEDYSRHRWNVGIEATFNPVYVRSEYIQGYDGGIHSRGGYVNVVCNLANKLDLMLNWDYIDKNTHYSRSEQEPLARNGWVTEQHTYTAGLQYWIYKKCRLSAHYVYTKPCVGEISREFISQLQISF